MVAWGLGRLSRDLNQQNDKLNQALTCVSCTDKNNKDSTGYLQVGVVKSGNIGLATIYERLFDQYLSIAHERETTEMSEAQRARDAIQ